MARIYTLRVEVALIHPPIWRGVEVPSVASLATLHLILQRMFGWDNSALYEFECAGDRFGAIDYDTLGRDDPRSFDVRDVRLASLVGESRREMTYIYDPMGEAWVHDLTLIAAGEPEDGVRYPRCVAGERSGPLRGVGGVNGYEEVLRRWRHRREHRGQALWPAHFDPERFDRDALDLGSFEQLSAMANASAGFHTVDLWSFAKPAAADVPAEAEASSEAQREFERQVAARRAPKPRPTPPEFASVQELITASEARLRSSEDAPRSQADAFSWNWLAMVEDVARNLGKLSNLHTRQLVVDALSDIPGLLPEPPKPEPPPAPETTLELTEESEQVPEPAFAPEPSAPVSAIASDVEVSQEVAPEPTSEAVPGPDTDLEPAPLPVASEVDANEQTSLTPEPARVSGAEDDLEGQAEEVQQDAPEDLGDALDAAADEPDASAIAPEEVREEEVLRTDEAGVKPLPSVLGLPRALARLPVEHLDIIVSAMEIAEPASRRKDRERQIIVELSDLENIDARLDTLDIGQLEVLAAVLERVDPVSATALHDRTRCHLDMRFDGGGEVGRLRRAGFLYTGEVGGEVVFWIPSELRQLLSIALG